MIRAIELGNVRLFDGKDWRFDLRPLTVFCGANSAGKSTLLKTFLVLAQSQNQKFAGRLCLAGPRVDFGDYRSFVSHRNVNEKVLMAAKVDVMVSSLSIDFLRALKRVGKQPKSSRDEVATTAEPAAFTSLPSPANAWS
jgi:ABC-type branched-subunit amino acid transport system ATPase component